MKFYFKCNVKICLIGTPMLNKSSISNMAPNLTSRELENRIQEYSDSLDEVIVITHTLQINTIESEHLWKAGRNEASKELKKFVSKNFEIPNDWKSIKNKLIEILV